VSLASFCSLNYRHFTLLETKDGQKGHRQPDTKLGILGSDPGNDRELTGQEGTKRVAIRNSIRLLAPLSPLFPPTRTRL
jgi:hypothetical protein